MLRKEIYVNGKLRIKKQYDAVPDLQFNIFIWLTLSIHVKKRNTIHKTAFTILLDVN
jgi:hypothetical protein